MKCHEISMVLFVSKYVNHHSIAHSEASDSLVQAWVAHEAVYLALMGHFTKLIDYMASWHILSKS